MNCLLSILLTAILCASASAQTIKTLGFNSTNGQVVANTTNALTFTNASVAFGGGDITIQSANILWGGIQAINLEEKYLSFNGQEKLRWQEEDVLISVPLSFSGTNTAPSTRTNLGIPLAALTNTSNVTIMRALAGSTNSSEPYSGTFYVTDPEAVGTWQLTFSNGILLSVIEI